MTGFKKIRIGGAPLFNHKAKRAASAACATGGFYHTPSNGQTLDSSKPVDISWDNSCLNASKVDIYLFAPTSQRARIHVWQSVDNQPGSFSTTLKPKWWNATASQTMQLTIIDAGQPPFLSSMPAGPVFTATYTAPADGHIPDDANPNIPDTNITNVNGAVSHSHLSKGKVAAAVLLPLLFIAAAIAIYMKMLRVKGIEKRKRWSEAVDKRMSTISTDWKAMSGAGANAAIRNSMAVSNHPYGSNGSSRLSMFDYGLHRPTSTATMGDYGNAGIGARGIYQQDNYNFNSSEDAPQMSQLRPGLTSASFAADRARVSRVSFADDPRLSVDSRRITSRAFHNSFVPPVPPKQQRQNTMDVDSTQREGPLDLTPDDIRARLSGHSEPRNSMDEVMPALSLMRTGGENPDLPNQGNNDDYLLWEATSPSTPSSPHPQPPPPAVPKSNLGMVPPMTMPPNVMSPDDMLRAYAERHVGADAPAFPGPVMYNGNGARTLYSPGPTSPSISARSPSTKSPKTLPSLLGRRNTKDKKASRMSDKWSEEDAYAGHH